MDSLDKQELFDALNFLASPSDKSSRIALAIDGLDVYSELYRVADNFRLDDHILLPLSLIQAAENTWPSVWKWIAYISSLDDRFHTLRMPISMNTVQTCRTLSQRLRPNDEPIRFSVSSKLYVGHVLYSVFVENVDVRCTYPGASRDHDTPVFAVQSTHGCYHVDLAELQDEKSQVSGMELLPWLHRPMSTHFARLYTQAVSEGNGKTATISLQRMPASSLLFASMPEDSLAGTSFSLLTPRREDSYSRQLAAQLVRQQRGSSSGSDTAVSRFLTLVH
ncbi:hypothetical protein BDZ89DRAFT_1032905 [Hymenopellis radicata]|nr:hypothetical protein BDZ89DRAFT_1032905 [Hymenopellis radicata]